MEVSGWGHTVPQQLIGGGHHSNDGTDRYFRRSNQLQDMESNQAMPQQVLLKLVVEKDLERKMPKGWKKLV